MSTTAKQWHQQQIDSATKLWSDGKSASEIGAVIGLTRCAVLGYASRHRKDFPARNRSPDKCGLNEEQRRQRRAEAQRERRQAEKASRPKAIWNTKLFVRPVKVAPVPAVRPDPAIVAASGKAVDLSRLAGAKKLTDLRNCECKWPVNDGGPYLFCAAPSSGRYCDHHTERARAR